MKITFVIGKGGVGKTTISSALALEASEKRRVLLYSLDPLPNAAYLFGLPSSFEPVKFNENLYVGETDYEKVKEWWLRRFGDEIIVLAKEVLKVSDEEAKEFASHVATAPGIAEQFVMLYAIEFARERNLDLIFDTPPVGPTLHMLKAEREFYEHLSRAYGIYMKIFSKLGIVSKRFFEIIKEWEGLAKEVLDAVASSEVVVVSTKERIALKVALDGLKEIEEFGARPSAFYFNRTSDAECVLEPTFVVPDLGEVYDVKGLREVLSSRRRIC